MKATPKDMVQALLDFAATQSNREEFLRGVQRELNREIGEAEKALRVEIVTPSGDAGPLAEHAVKTLQQKTGRPVELIQRADPSMIGGVILHFGDEQVDMSLRTALQQAAHSIGKGMMSHS